MELIENLSPNVKLVLPSMYEHSVPHLNNGNLRLLYSIVHPNGIIEIDINTEESNNDFNKSLSQAFSRYFNWFGEKGFLEDVSITGVSSNLELGAGSTRFSTISPILASIITELVLKSNVLDKVVDPSIGKFYKVADYFRFMRYTSGGEHYPHYDSDYKFTKSNFETKYSLVLYHNQCNDGELYFCNDSRDSITSDWDRQAREDEIYLKIKPDSLKLVLFPHTLCHGVAPFTGDQRDIIRGDLIFLVPESK